MDPATAAQTAGVAFQVAQLAWSVGKTLYDFVQDVRHIDSTAEEFANEVWALGTACDVVGGRVQKIVEEHEAGQYQKGSSTNLLSCLQRQLQSCLRTVSQLQTAVKCVAPDKIKDAKLIELAYRQIKLNMKATDIEVARNRIKSHISSLQLTLSSVAIEISYVIPNRVDHQLQPQLEKISSLQMELQELRAQRTEPTSPQQDEETDVLNISEKVKSSGETLYNESVSGGSVLGEPLTGKMDFLYSWINDADMIESLAPSTSATEDTETPSVFSAGKASGMSHTEETLSTSAAGKADADDAEGDDAYELDSDDETAIEATEMAIADGREAFQQQNYTETAELLQEALKMVRELPINRQTICDAQDVRYMLGVCAFHLDKPTDAKEALLSIVKNMPSAKYQESSHWLQYLEAGHLLAQTHLKLGENELARASCDSTLQGRRRILGKTHDAYYESLALRVRIYEVQGSHTRAKAYGNLLPKDRRDAFIKTYENLGSGDMLSSKAVVTEPDLATIRSFSIDGVSTMRGQHPLATTSPPARVKSESDVVPGKIKSRSRGDQVDPNAHQFQANLSDTTESSPFRMKSKRPSEVLKHLPPPHNDSEASRAVPQQNTSANAEYQGPDTVNMTSIAVTAGQRGSSTGFQDTPIIARTNDVQHALRPKDQTELPMPVRSRVPQARTTHDFKNSRLQALANNLGFEQPPPARKETREALSAWLGLLSNFSNLSPLTRSLIQNRDHFSLAQDQSRIKLRMQRNSSMDKNLAELHMACLFGDLEVVETLVAKGAKVNMRCSVNDLTPLHCAVMGGRIAIVKVLLAVGSHIDTVSWDMGTPLCLAFIFERLDIIDLLCHKGANLSANGGRLGSACHAACATGNLDLFRSFAWDEELLKSDPGFVVSMPLVRTFLSLRRTGLLPQSIKEAIVDDSTDLPEVEAPPRLKRLLDVSPLALATYMGYEDMVHYLLGMNDDISALCRVFLNGKTTRGGCELEREWFSLLDLACIGGSAAITELILSKGFQIQDDSCVSKKGTIKDEVWHAESNEHWDCAAIVKHHKAKLMADKKHVDDLEVAMGRAFELPKR